MFLFSRKKSDIPRRRINDDLDCNNKINFINNFRRNRTISGIKKPVNIENESNRLNLHQLSLKRQKLVRILLVTSATVIILLLFLLNFIAIVNVKIVSVDLSIELDRTKFENVIYEYLNTYPLARFKPFSDPYKLNNFVIDRVPEIEDIVQSDDYFLGGSDYFVKLRKPVASWIIEDDKNYVDGNGIAFDVNYFSDSILEIKDNSGVGIDSGAANVSKRFLSFIGQVVSLSKNRGIEVSEAILPQNTTRRLDVKIKNSLNSIIKMTIDRPAGEQVEDMDRVVRYFLSNNQDPEYIDVRVPEKAYYK